MTQAEAAKEDLRAVLRTVLASGYEPENLVTAVASSQSLDRLAPDNPIASELAALREQVEKVDGRVAAITRRLPRPTADLGALRKFVEFLASEGGYVSSNEMSDHLIQDETSPSFDSWVREQALILEGNAGRWNINEASGSDGQGYGFDEEPF